MKIVIPTQEGESLQNKIFEYVEDGNLKTWIIRKNKEGTKFLTHSPDQWYDLVLLGFIVKDDQLKITINWWKDKEPDENTKGYYLGRFTEVLLVHFKDEFTTFTISK